MLGFRTFKDFRRLGSGRNVFRLADKSPEQPSTECTQYTHDCVYQLALHVLMNL